MLRAREITKRFGRIARARPRRFRGASGRDSRAGRRKWRRQNHADEYHRGPAAPRRGRAPRSTAQRCGTARRQAQLSSGNRGGESKPDALRALHLGGKSRARRFWQTAGYDLRRPRRVLARSPKSLGFVLPPAGSTIEHRSVAERVRLEVLRALSFDPRVLILDEPTGVMAPAETRAVSRSVAAAARRGQDHRPDHAQAQGGARRRRSYERAAPGPDGCEHHACGNVGGRARPDDDRRSYDRARRAGDAARVASRVRAKLHCRSKICRSTVTDIARSTASSLVLHAGEIAGVAGRRWQRTDRAG